MDAPECHESWQDMKWAGIGAVIGGIAMPLLILLDWIFLSGDILTIIAWYDLFILPGNLVGWLGSYHGGADTFLVLSAPFNAGIYAAFGYGLWHARHRNRQLFILLGAVVAVYWTVLALWLW